MTQKQSVKQSVKVIIGDSVLLKSGRRRKAVRRKKAVKKPVGAPPVPPQPPRYSMFGSQIFAQPPQFLRAELPAVKVAQPATPVVQKISQAIQTEQPTPQLTRKATEPIVSFVEKKGMQIPEPVRSFISPKQGSMSLADLIRRESSISPIPVIKVPSVRDLNLDSKEPESAPNQANQPSVDVSRPDPRPPSPQAPAGAPLVAAQPAYIGQPAYVAPVFVEANVPTPGGEFSSDPFFRAQEVLRQFDYYNQRPRGKKALEDWAALRAPLLEEIERLRPPAPVIQR